MWAGKWYITRWIKIEKTERKCCLPLLRIRSGANLRHLSVQCIITKITWLPTLWKYDTHLSNSLGDIRQNHWPMKYRSQWPTFILKSNAGSYWPKIPKYDVHTSNSFQDITQNHWTMKYRSQWPTFIFRSNVGSYWPIIPNNDVHISNGLQDIRQNHWTMKYGSQWPTLFWGHTDSKSKVWCSYSK